MQDAFADLAAKIATGAALTDADAHRLMASPDLLTIGMLAEGARRRRHGARATYLRVSTVDVGRAAAGVVTELAEDAGEWRVVGSVTDPQAALSAITKVATRAGRTPVTGFSLDELVAVAREQPDGLLPLLQRLRDAGLALVAEAPLDRLTDPARTLETVWQAGLGLARLTVAGDAPDERFVLLRRAADLQRTVGGLRSFAPLPRTTGRQNATGYDDVKHVAMARLLVDVPSIQVDWTLAGPKLAQVALTFGADDLDAVPADERSEHGRRRAPREEVQRNIRAAALEPVERDARFEVAA